MSNLSCDVILLKHISSETSWLLILAKSVIFSGCLTSPHKDILNERVILNGWASINNGRNGNVSAVIADIQNKGEKVLGREALQEEPEL